MGAPWRRPGAVMARLVALAKAGLSCGDGEKLRVGPREHWVLLKL